MCPYSRIKHGSSETQVLPCTETQTSYHDSATSSTKSFMSADSDTTNSLTKSRIKDTV